MLEFNVLADIGSSYTRLAAGNRFVSDETRAAIDPADGKRVLAFGRRAGKLLNANSVYPVRGCISDVTLTAVMLRRFTLDLIKRSSLMGVSLRLAMPLSASQTELNAALSAGREAGFTRITIEDAQLAGFLGAGLDPFRQDANMVVNIGRERISSVAAANGGVIARSSHSFGSSAFDRHLQAYFAMEHGLLLSFYAAEQMKKELHKPLLRVHGRDSGTGQPLMRAVETREIRNALKPTVRMLAAAITAAIGELPPDSAADLVDNGVTLIGGGALLFGLDSALEEELGIPVRSASNAENAVILGMKDLLRLKASEGILKGAG